MGYRDRLLLLASEINDAKDDKELKRIRKKIYGVPNKGLSDEDISLKYGLLVGIAMILNKGGDLWLTRDGKGNT